jgi:hypothetical protein
MTDAGGTNISFTYAQTVGYGFVTITQAVLPNYNLVTDVQGNHAHGWNTAPGGNHTHSTDVQGSHSHGGATGGVGDHQHEYQTPSPNVPITWGGASYINAGNFDHNGWYTGPAGAHSHTISVDGSHGHNISYSGNFQLGIYPDGNHQHNVSLGGYGGSLNVLSPVIVITKIIFAGLQAATMLAAEAAPMTIEHEPLTGLDELREEIAQLKALLMPPLQRRALSSPVRGPH